LFWFKIIIYNVIKKLVKDKIRNTILMIGVIITIIVVTCIIIIFSLVKVASYGEFLKDKKRNEDKE
jgi:uncharacterized membrane protein